MNFSGIDVGSRGTVFCLQNRSGLKWGKKSKFEAERREFADIFETECLSNLFLDVSHI